MLACQVGSHEGPKGAAFLAVGLAVLLTVVATPMLAQGAAGTGGADGASKQLQKCEKPLGVIAVVEPQDAVERALSMYKLGSPTGLIRLMIQQSNCFLIAERGQGMQNVMQERALAESGQLRQGSNIGGGQMVAADFVLTPSVVFSEGNAGGVGGVLGGIAGRMNPLLAVAAAGLRFKEAQTSMILADARSGLQVASAQGSAKKADWGLGGLGATGSGVAALGAYSNTNEGKVVASSFLDNFNKIVAVVRNDTTLQRNVKSLAEASAKKVDAGAGFQEGDVVSPKIANVKLLAEPRDSAKVVATLSKTEELVFLGKEKDGYIFVQASNASGWVRTLMVMRK